MALEAWQNNCLYEVCPDENATQIVLWHILIQFLLYPV